MSNYYSQFSEAFKVTPEEEAWINELLKTEFPFEGTDEEKLAWEEARGIGKDDDVESYPHFEWKMTGEGEDRDCWIHSDEGYDENHLIGFIQAYLSKFHPDMVLTISGAGTCSRPIIGEFGGFWLAISADSVLGGSTWDAANKAAKRLKAKIAKKKVK